MVGYDGHIIYWVHITEQNKIIKVKNLRIFENHKSKNATDLPDNDNSIPTFQEFILDDNDDDKKESLQNSDENQKVNTEKIQQTSTTCGKSQKIRTVEHISSTCTKFQSGHTVKPSAKAQETLAQWNYLFPIEQSSEIEKIKILTLVEQSSEFEKQKYFSPIE